MGQLELFPSTKEEKVLLVCGGIYTDKNPEDTDPEAPYAICFGKNAFCFLFSGIDHIENIVEVATAHRMKLVEGYSLAILKNKKIFQIRSSYRKGSPDYILFEGSYEETFEESLKPYLKIFHK